MNPNAEAPNLKTAAYQLIDSLPSNATWDDVIYQCQLRQRIEAGLADANAARLVNVNEVRRQFGLNPIG